MASSSIAERPLEDYISQHLWQIICSKKNQRKIFGRGSAKPQTPRFILQLLMLSKTLERRRERPFIIIMDRCEEHAKRAVDVLRKHPDMQGFGFELLACEDKWDFCTKSTAYGTALGLSAPEFAWQAPWQDTHTQHLSRLNEGDREMSLILSGRLLKIRSAAASDETWKVGGYLKFGKERSALTAAHAFMKDLDDQPNDYSLDNSEDGSESECDSESDDDNDDDNDSDIDGDIDGDSGNINDGRNNDPTRSSNADRTNDHLVQFDIESAADAGADQRHWSPGPQSINPALDWALVGRSHRPMVQIKPPECHRVQQVFPGVSPPNRQILMFCGKSGLLWGKLLGMSSSISLPWNSKLAKSQVTVVSWVMSLDLRTLYGIVIACSPAMKLTYLIPAEAIFRDIFQRIGLPEDAMSKLDCSQDPEPVSNKLLNLPVQSCRFNTMLTIRARSFVCLRQGDYAACACQVLKFPGLQSEPELSFTLHAEFAFATGDEDCAKRCIQGATFLSFLNAAPGNGVSPRTFLKMVEIRDQVVISYVAELCKHTCVHRYCTSGRTSNMAPDFITALVKRPDGLWDERQELWPYILPLIVMRHLRLGRTQDVVAIGDDAISKDYGKTCSSRNPTVSFQTGQSKPWVFD
ncbi:uncharacterized protein A1O5_00849 [Cladophialophora psammophila CBS 110553]|uniref:Uncharacterized protein n=1 Tax=Cladophialophora psammophila CBS 110553 TaxID=1182543 RepID=W9XHE4_9EURO|nr:uncharacterized protein A1O5_00849 [Cladophialophora psammophila CBS 110553]EXJ76341.1 hypothetical protein A1O5_00849 [Cladophialophora psammophila CBS 110553]